MGGDQASSHGSRLDCVCVGNISRVAAEQVIAVMGAQWGDEGKGKLVDVLGANFDIIARCAGGSNAGMDPTRCSFPTPTTWHGLVTRMLSVHIQDIP